MSNQKLLTVKKWLEEILISNSEAPQVHEFDESLIDRSKDYSPIT